MPLTPASTDPNRKSELERMKKDPYSFGHIQPEKKETLHLPKKEKQNGTKTT